MGVWRAGWFYLRNDNSTGMAQGSFPFGNPTDQPAAGNWDGDPFDTVGVYQDNAFYYANTNLRPVAAGRLPFGAGPTASSSATGPARAGTRSASSAPARSS